MRPGVVLMALHGKVKQMKRIQATPRCAHALINCNTSPSAAFLRFLQARLCRSLCHRRGRQVITHIISTLTRPKPRAGALIFHPWTGLCSSIAPTPLRHTSIALDVRRRHHSQASSFFPNPFFLSFPSIILLLRHVASDCLSQALRGTTRRERHF